MISPNFHLVFLRCLLFEKFRFRACLSSPRTHCTSDQHEKFGAAQINVRWLLHACESKKWKNTKIREKKSKITSWLFNSSQTLPTLKFDCFYGNLIRPHNAAQRVLKISHFSLIYGLEEACRCSTKKCTTNAREAPTPPSNKRYSLSTITKPNHMQRGAYESCHSRTQTRHIDLTAYIKIDVVMANGPPQSAEGWLYGPWWLSPQCTELLYIDTV